MDKLVIDLGCSGGYFSFKIADQAKHVWAVDADAQLIERNRVTARRYGYSNISFVCDVISPGLIDSFPHADVTLFLSVFHHLLTASDVYDWNESGDAAGAMDVLSAIAHHTEVLVFEIGYPDEGHEWCARMPDMSASPQAWVVSLLRAYFETVETLRPPVHCRWFKKIFQVMRRRGGRHLGFRVVQRMLAMDPRDARDLYVARRSKSTMQEGETR